MKPLAIMGRVMPEVKIRRDDAETVGNDSPQPGACADPDSVCNDTFLELSPSFDAHAATDYAAADICFQNLASLAHHGFRFGEAARAAVDVRSRWRRAGPPAERDRFPLGRCRRTPTPTPIAVSICSFSARRATSSRGGAAVWGTGSGRVVA